MNTESMEAIAKKYTEELSLAKRHAKQLLELDAEARDRVRKQTEAMLAAAKQEK